MSRRPLRDLKIEEDIISIFASGTSVLDIPEKDIKTITSKTFSFGLNYSVYLPFDALVFSDVRVRRFLQTWYAKHPKDRILVARDEAFPGKKELQFARDNIDFWFGMKRDALKGRYTIIWFLQLVNRIWGDKKVLLFGLDGYPGVGEHDGLQKWYDYYTDFDTQSRSSKRRANRLPQDLERVANELDKFVRNDHIYNGNPMSNVGHFEKVDWREELKLPATG